jgi:hypothetical protein
MCCDIQPKLDCGLIFPLRINHLDCDIQQPHLCKWIDEIIVDGIGMRLTG